MKLIYIILQIIFEMFKSNIYFLYNKLNAFIANAVIH